MKFFAETHVCPECGNELARIVPSTWHCPFCNGDWEKLIPHQQSLDAHAFAECLKTWLNLFMPTVDEKDSVLPVIAELLKGTPAYTRIRLFSRTDGTIAEIVKEDSDPDNPSSASWSVVLGTLSSICGYSEATVNTKEAAKILVLGRVVYLPLPQKMTVDFCGDEDDTENQCTVSWNIQE